MPVTKAPITNNVTDDDLLILHSLSAILGFNALPREHANSTSSVQREYYPMKNKIGLVLKTSGANGERYSHVH